MKSITISEKKLKKMIKQAIKQHEKMDKKRRKAKEMKGPVIKLEEGQPVMEWSIPKTPDIPYKRELKEELEEIVYKLKYYKDTWLEGDKEGRPRTCICWPEGDTLGFGFASGYSNDPGGFKPLGFNGLDDFYEMPIKLRNKFLRMGCTTFRNVFPKLTKKKLTHMSREELNEKLEKLKKELKVLAKKIKKRKTRKTG